MPLPKAIEYLLSIERENGSGPLVLMGASQIYVTVPPNTSVAFDSGPVGDDYANIVYSGAFDSAMVPDSLSAGSGSRGARAYEGIMSTWFLQNTDVPLWVVITRNSRVAGILTNRTNLNQYYRGVSLFVSIANEEDYNYVIKVLRDARTSVELQEEANSLLKSMISEQR